MVMPAAVSISVSASTKGSRRRAASSRPTVDLPAPIIPTSTISRLQRAARIARSGAVGLGAGCVVAVISPLLTQPLLLSKASCSAPYNRDRRLRTDLPAGFEHVG